MTYILIVLLSGFAFSGDFVFDSEKGRAVPSYIGQIKLMKGKVFRKNGDKTEIVERGARFKQDDILMTGEGSLAKVQIVDDTTISIGPKSELRFDNMDFRDKSDRKLKFTLLKGQARGKIRKKAQEGDIIFRTRYTTMGVRGTEFLMNHQTLKNLDIAEYALLEGEVGVQSGKSQLLKLTRGDRIVLVHDTSRNLSQSDRLLLSSKEIESLKGENINEDKNIKPFLPYFNLLNLESHSPLYPLIKDSSLTQKKEEVFSRPEEPKPHYEKTLQELNRKLRENQKGN